MAIQTKKYKLLENKRCRKNGYWVCPIIALKTFGNIRKGQKGGYVSSEANLSQEGTCWVYPNAMVVSDASVRDDAQIFSGIVQDSAVIADNAKIGDRNRGDSTIITGSAVIINNARVYGAARVGGRAVIKDCASVDDYVVVEDDVVIGDNASAFGHAILFGNAELRDRSFVCGHAKIGGNTKLIHCANVHDNSIVIDAETVPMWNNKKYILLPRDTKVVDGHTLTRIMSVIDSPSFHYGELGGYIESEANLDHAGDCWIGPEAYIYGDQMIRYDIVCKNPGFVDVTQEEAARRERWKQFE